ncbi:hypothetical protein SUGI_0394880 [Cryptomeria japonica]|nr:hypothetical protein SUGI_0394880 [Cryptomeria japonica]
MESKLAMHFIPALATPMDTQELFFRILTSVSIEDLHFDFKTTDETLGKAMAKKLQSIVMTGSPSPSNVDKLSLKFDLTVKRGHRGCKICSRRRGQFLIFHDLSHALYNGT